MGCKEPQVKEGKAAVWVLWNNLSMSDRKYEHNIECNIKQIIICRYNTY